MYRRILFLNAIRCWAILSVALCAGGFTFADMQLSVMTFNLRYGTAQDGPNSWDHRKDIVVNTIREYAPDVLGAQECLKFQADYIDAALPGYEHFGVGRNPDGSSERMEVFYRTDRLAPIETGSFWLSETPGIPGSRSWNTANIRMATWARFYRLDDRRFFYYLNTHFDHRSEEARVQAARMVAEWARQRPENTPVIIGGDFNAKAEASEPWSILTSRLQDAWLAAPTRQGPAVTWSAFKPPADVVNRIDWLLFRGPIHATACRTITYNENGRYPSDHFPVIAHFEFGE